MWRREDGGVIPRGDRSRADLGSSSLVSSPPLLPFLGSCCSFLKRALMHPAPPKKKGRAMDTTLRSLPRATQTFPHIIITRNTFLGKYSLPHPLPRPFPSPLPSPCHSLPVLPLPSSTPSLVSPSQISPPSPALKLLLHILPHILPSNSSNTLTLTPALKPVHYTLPHTLPHTAPPPTLREGGPRK